MSTAPIQYPVIRVPGLSGETLAKLRSEHPRNRYVIGDADEWAVFLAPPPQGAVKAYHHMVLDPAQRGDAQDELFKHMAKACWTEWDGECSLETLLSRFPSAAYGAGDSVMSLVGMKAVERGKR